VLNQRRIVFPPVKLDQWIGCPRHVLLKSKIIIQIILDSLIFNRLDFAFNAIWNLAKVSAHHERRQAL
jgi:hypothetical protein